MAEPEVLTALRQQVQQLQQELQTQQQQHSRNASTTEAVPAGSTEDVTAPTEGIPHAASYDTWCVAIKLPPFWVDSPKVWFAQVEAQFSLAHITQNRTRYDYVVAHLDARYANEVRDILANPPTANLYEHLKTALILHLSLSSCATGVRSRATCKSRILSCERFGSNDSHRTSRQFCKLRLGYLSTNLRRLLIASSRPPCRSCHPLLQAVAAPLNTTELARRIDDIDRQLTSIQQRLGERLPMQQRHHLQSRDLNTTSSRQPDNNGPYDYHRRFGDRAWQCRPPCSVGHAENANGSS
ncbi:hypothetical protein HPB49_001936 [Dermacentor silvarum]|uniref:Uncharacterized protein n=1 Tax=Dermacentor silvarum TaxID=543639 RepID=A0ACB8D9Y6_DERSI|nr:hypothetical protein HPB49_001936 [Dermacentor silvarum]